MPHENPNRYNVPTTSSSQTCPPVPQSTRITQTRPSLAISSITLYTPTKKCVTDLVQWDRRTEYKEGAIDHKTYLVQWDRRTGVQGVPHCTSYTIYTLSPPLSTTPNHYARAIDGAGGLPTGLRRCDARGGLQPLSASVAIKVHVNPKASRTM
jgi:hypothetical protein